MGKAGAMRRAIIDLRHRLRRRAMALLGWRTQGVKVMLFDGTGALLLVRHGYGRPDLWMLPGGGIGRRETPDAAARREVREELGCDVDALRPLGVYRATAEGRRDTVHLFRAVVLGKPRPDGVELVEAAYFPPDALPEAASPATRRRVAEMLGGGVPSDLW